MLTVLDDTVDTLVVELVYEVTVSVLDVVVLDVVVLDVIVLVVVVLDVSVDVLVDTDVVVVVGIPITTVFPESRRCHDASSLER